MFPVFVAMLAFPLLILVRRMLVLFMLAAMLVFLPLVFAAAAVMFGSLCLLAVRFGCSLSLQTQKQVVNISLKL